MIALEGRGARPFGLGVMRKNRTACVANGLEVTSIRRLAIWVLPGLRRRRRHCLVMGSLAFQKPAYATRCGVVCAAAKRRV